MLRISYTSNENFTITFVTNNFPIRILLFEETNKRKTKLNNNCAKILEKTAKLFIILQLFFDNAIDLKAIATFLSSGSDSDSDSANYFNNNTQLVVSF